MNKHNFVIKIHTLWHSLRWRCAHFSLFVYSSAWNKTELLYMVCAFFSHSCCLTFLSFRFAFVGLDAIKSYFKKYDTMYDQKDSLARKAKMKRTHTHKIWNRIDWEMCVGFIDVDERRKEHRSSHRQLNAISLIFSIRISPADIPFVHETDIERFSA